MEESIALHQREIRRYEQFADEMGFEYIDSYTNFITYLFPETLNSTQIADTLFREGIIIRNLASYGLNGIRITIGTENQNSRFFETYRKVCV